MTVSEVLCGSSWSDVMGERGEFVSVSKHSSSLNKLNSFFFFRCESDCYSGCKSWEKAKKPIAAVKTNCVCYCGHCIGKVNMFTHIMENMIVSQHQENYVKNFSAQLFIMVLLFWYLWQFLISLAPLYFLHAYCYDSSCNQCEKYPIINYQIAFVCF